MIHKISHKLILAVAGVTVLTVGIFAYFMIRSQHTALIHQIEHSASQISETIKSGTKYDMLLNQREHIHRIIDMIGRQEGLEKIRVFNKQGEIIYSSVKAEIGEMVDKRAESCYACHEVDRPLQRLSIPERTRIFGGDGHDLSLGIINPIYNEMSCWQASCHAHDQAQSVLGILDVTMSLSEVEQQIAAHRLRMLFLAAGSILLISLLLWVLVQKLVGKPVAGLVDATRIVGSGNLEYKVPKLSRDELGQLAKAFNEMTSKLVLAQRQLYHSDKLASLGRLAAGLAHEINNPLTGVLSYSSVLQKRKEFEPEVRKDLEVIVNETKRCREIVKRLLDFARPQPAEKKQADLDDVIARTLAILENQFKKRRVEIETRLSPDLPQIYADAAQLQQVLVNLLVNAADALGDQGGTVTIATAPANVTDGAEAVTLNISDTGCGIASDDLTRIFEPFFTTKGQQGTGLGLAVVWGIVEEHGGTISVSSKPGDGTTFTVQFPVTNKVQVPWNSQADKKGLLFENN